MQIEQVKKNLNKMVVYRGKQGVYKLTGCIIRKNTGGFYYQAELYDTTNNNTVVICGLNDIEAEEYA